MPKFRKSSATRHETYANQHRFEHWYRDNTLYFITSRVSDRSPAFATDRAKDIFFDRFDHYTSLYGFTPCVTTVLNNHYHTEGHMREGANLGPMMQKIHGSVAKFVNDLIEPRIVPFWRTAGNQDYFDGCLRNEKQARLTYRYVLLQAVRAGIVSDYRDYPYTRVRVELEVMLKRAKTINAYLPEVTYARYTKRRPGR